MKNKFLHVVISGLMGATVASGAQGMTLCKLQSPDDKVSVNRQLVQGTDIRPFGGVGVQEVPVTIELKDVSPNCDNGVFYWLQIKDWGDVLATIKMGDSYTVDKGKYRVISICPCISTSADNYVAPITADPVDYGAVYRVAFTYEGEDTRYFDVVCREDIKKTFRSDAEARKYAVKTSGKIDSDFSVIALCDLDSKPKLIAAFRAPISCKINVKLSNVWGKDQDIRDRFCLGLKKEYASEFIKQLCISDAIAEGVELNKGECLEIVSLPSRNNLPVKEFTHVDIDEGAAISGSEGYPEPAFVRCKIQFENVRSSDSEMQSKCDLDTSTDAVIHSFAGDDGVSDSSEGE